MTKRKNEVIRNAENMAGGIEDEIELHQTRLGVVRHFLNGGRVERLILGDPERGWEEDSEPVWDWDSAEYRAKRWWVVDVEDADIPTLDAGGGISKPSIHGRRLMQVVEDVSWVNKRLLGEEALVKARFCDDGSGDCEGNP